MNGVISIQVLSWAGLGEAGCIGMRMAQEGEFVSTSLVQIIFASLWKFWSVKPYRTNVENRVSS